MGHGRPLYVALGCLACSAVTAVLAEGAGEVVALQADADVVNAEATRSGDKSERGASLLLDARDRSVESGDVVPLGGLDAQAASVPAEASPSQSNMGDLEGAESAFFPKVQTFGELERNKRTQLKRSLVLAVAAALFWLIGMMVDLRAKKEERRFWTAEMFDPNPAPSPALKLPSPSATIALAFGLHFLFRLALFFPAMRSRSLLRQVRSVPGGEERGESPFAESPLEQRAEASEVLPSVERPAAETQEALEAAADGNPSALETAESAFLPRVVTVDDWERKKRMQLRRSIWLFVTAVMFAAFSQAGVLTAEAVERVVNTATRRHEEFPRPPGVALQTAQVVAAVSMLSVLASLLHLSLRFALWFGARWSLSFHRSNKSPLLFKDKNAAARPDQVTAPEEKVSVAGANGLPQIQL